jgi:tellurite resistance protein TehA-like permease
MRSKEYYDMKAAPLKNAALMTPIISAAMSMNVLIGVVRFFVPSVSTNFQALMLPALIVWLGVWVWLMYMEISLLKISFTKEFDVNKISFGWLLHPFALSMVTVTGMGIAAMAKNHNIADTAVMLSMVSGTMGLFLFIVKLISIFKSHFVAKGIPERQFLPSFLIVVPIMTLFTISIFRFGHYMEHRFDFDMPWFFSIVVMVGFAFETWYLAFGLGMLKDYFKKDFFKNEYYVTLWAFICPFVAYAVLGSFLYKTFLATSIIEFVIYASMITSISMYGIVGKRAIQNRRMPKINSLSTSK